MTVLVLVPATRLSDLDGEKSWILPSSRLLCGVRWLETDVSGRPVGPTFKGEAVQDVYSWTSWPLKMGPIDTPESSVWNHLTARSNPEDGRIQFNRGGNLRYCRKGGVIGRAFGFARYEEEVCACVRACHFIGFRVHVTRLLTLRGCVTERMIECAGNLDVRGQ
jgi:hypothetical protein